MKIARHPAWLSFLKMPLAFLSHLSVVAIAESMFVFSHNVPRKRMARMKRHCAEKAYGADEKCVFSTIAHSAENLHNIAVTINAHCAVSLQ